MTEITHLLITRFNLNYGDLYPYSEAWMDHRMGLFERYCLPSVARQSCTGFRWLVFFDRDRTRPREAAVRALLDRPGWAPVFVDSPSEMIESLRAQAPAQGLFLTTRLDNDDALHPDFVADVQARARMLADRPATLPAIVDAPLATWWQEGTARARQYRSQMVTPFATMVERPGPQGWETGAWGTGPRTVFIARHENLDKRVAHVDRLEAPRGLTVLHGQNVSNGRSRFGGAAGWLAKRVRNWRDRKSYLNRQDTAALLRDFGLAAN
ncbi:glycosyltransferase [Rhodovulum adriaticum]|uniref:Putative rhamnosyltransferase n=1 Tax=Rhodovulum adriaticum TaxID=35804 RepID=A0A4R2NYF1_RHOAD|nr:glycosyltransferase [Rhodovulum adriaticum]MBK1634199.1 hypothetical protein [Rhodovulum adriaticum]TCP27250.1 putative rhamnosyltransferase [Rhodovulum adriaticum]